LAKAGYEVLCAARRSDRIDQLAEEIGGRAITVDITNDADVAKLAQAAGGKVDILVNNAGGAFGLGPVATADLGDWEKMYQVNVIGTAKVTQALLPAITAAEGAIVFVTSTAADWGYEGGAGYCGAKAAERSIVESLRLESYDQPIRITEICPGMVRTPEFSLTRLGDAAKAEAVYAGVPNPLVAEDVAAAITFMATAPKHVNIDRLTIRPIAQAAQYKVYRQR
jgi:NADP-dependent 3-hydroxy acid dehydrogenase YdfG